jgi:hypothetical protein
MFAKLLKDTKTKKKTKILIRAPREYNASNTGMVKLAAFLEQKR